MFSETITAAICGLEARKVTVEVDVSDGMPVFSMVGFLASEVREAQDRVRTALKNMGIRMPVKRITVNLAPGDLRKAGAGFDLPIAAAVLGALGEVPCEALHGILFAGELSLNGEIRGIHGILEIVSRARQFGCHSCVIPLVNLKEGAVIEDVRVFGAESLRQVAAFLLGEETLAEDRIQIEEIRQIQEKEELADFSRIRGQQLLRRAAEIAVAGEHNLLMIGPPGAGKTMTAKAIPSILPSPERSEILEISRIHSVAGTLPEGEGLLAVRPFRSPHHTISMPGLAGGGLWPKPGEISLAHRGVLFLDELAEFDKATLEVLRQPLEEGCIHIARTAGTFVFPARFIFVAAMNPCKCGYFPDRSRCRCTTRDVKRYLSHVSQPLLDRMDLCVEAEEPTYEELTGKEASEASAVIRQRVEQARKTQAARFAGSDCSTNGRMSGALVEKYCILGYEQERLMKQLFGRMRLTGRSHQKILKVARTIADLEGSEEIRSAHLLEAAQYRMPDRRYWGGEGHGRS